MRASNYSRGNLDTLASTWLATVRDRVAPRPHLRVAPSKAALLIIDMLRYFVHPDGRCFLDTAPEIVPRIGALIDKFRENERPVIYTCHSHTGNSDLGMLGRFFSDYIRRGEEDAEIIPALSPQKKDVVIFKTTYDAFYNTELEGVLRGQEVEQVVITGVLTHMCCETTARAAFCRGFEVYIPVDGVASSREELHVNSLVSMADSCGVMMSTQEVIDACT